MHPCPTARFAPSTPSSAHRVRDAREHAGVTQDQLAAHLEPTRASVANLEAGRQRISAYHLAVLASALDIPIVDLAPAVEPAERRAAVVGADPEHLDLLQQVLAAVDVEDMDEEAHAAS
jgi:transcriptional regulator with XRE-family HTH domain